MCERDRERGREGCANLLLLPREPTPDFSGHSSTKIRPERTDVDGSGSPVPFPGLGMMLPEKFRLVNFLAAVFLPLPLLAFAFCLSVIYIFQ